MPLGDVRTAELRYPPTATKIAGWPPKAMPKRSQVQGEVRSLHDSPSGEVIIVLLMPTAINSLSAQIAPRSEFFVALWCKVQYVPSGEVRMTPESPAATNRLLPHVTQKSSLDVPVVCFAQLVPFAEVIIVPESPTATYLPPPKTTPRSSALVQALVDTVVQVVCATTLDGGRLKMNSTNKANTTDEIEISIFFKFFIIPPFFEMVMNLFPNPISFESDTG
jgi:hypothetical protein